MLSVIVPFKMPAKGIERTLTSIDSQNSDSLEVICVCPAPQDEYDDVPHFGVSDQVKVIFSNDGSYGALCAKALEQAQGELVTILRAADAWGPRFVEIVEEGFADGSVDILVTDCVEFGDKRVEPDTGLRECRSDADPADVLLALYTHEDRPWNKVYRRSLLDPEDFAEHIETMEAVGRLAELTAFARARRVAAAPLACYRQLYEPADRFDKMEIEEEMPYMLSSLVAIDRGALVWEENHKLETRKSDFLAATRFIIERAFLFDRKHFKIIATAFHTYFTQHFDETDLSREWDGELLRFYRSLNNMGAARFIFGPKGFFALMDYTSYVNVNSSLKSLKKGNKELSDGNSRTSIDRRR